MWLDMMIYTPWVIKKRATLFGIITPMFHGASCFMIFTLLAPVETGKILYRGIAKFATLPQLCLYTTWENLKTHTTAHFETDCQCILMLNAINGKNEFKWTVFRSCAQNVHPLLAHRLPNTLIGQQHCQWSAARLHSRRLADAAEVHQCSECDAIITS